MISGIVLLFINKNNQKSSILSGIVLIVIFGLTLADNFIKPYMLTPFLVRLIFIFSRNSYFLIGPLLWFYTRSLLLPGKSVKKYYILHIFPFTAWVVTFLIFPKFQLPLISPDFPIHQPMQPMPGVDIFGFIRNLTSVLSRVIYSVAVIILIFRHSKSVPDFYSRLTIRNTLSWLFYLILIYTILFLLNTFMFLFPFLAGEYMEIITTVVRILPSILFIFFFSLFAGNQSIPEDRMINEKYIKSGLSDIESKKLLATLREHLEKEKSYLNPNLTLDQLASEMNETRHRLSEVINRESSINFYGFINAFRLQEFLNAIDEDRFPHFTILAIALECGFKSTSAFYSLFKKNMGKTPKEYARSLHE